MSEQITLDGWALHTHDNPFSKEAAASMVGKAGGQRRRILRFVADYGPISAQNIELGTGIAGNSVRPAVLALQEAHLVRVMGEGRTRSGRRCGLYVLTGTGYRVLSELAR